MTSMIIDEMDRIKIHAILGQEFAQRNPEIARTALNANSYRLAFLEDLDIQSTMFDKYKSRLCHKGMIQEVKHLSEFAKMTLASEIKLPEPKHLD